MQVPQNEPLLPELPEPPDDPDDPLLEPVDDPLLDDEPDESLDELDELPLLPLLADEVLDSAGLQQTYRSSPSNDPSSNGCPQQTYPGSQNPCSLSHSPKIQV